MIKKTKSLGYQKLINSVRWVALRNTYISEHPLCEDCLLKDKSKLAEEVHHIKPIEDARGNPLMMEKLAYDVSNLRALCRSCHYQAHVLLRSRSKEANRKRQAEATQNFVSRFLCLDDTPEEGTNQEAETHLG